MGEPVVAQALGRGAYLVDWNGRRRIAYVAGPPGARWVFVDGHTFVIDVSGGEPHGSARLDADSLSAPMPATVVTIHIAPGQRVSAGDVLVTLEAMKMEWPIRAPRDANVTSIGCRVGELVQPGVPLLVLA